MRHSFTFIHNLRGIAFGGIIFVLLLSGCASQEASREASTALADEIEAGGFCPPQHNYPVLHELEKPYAPVVGGSKVNILGVNFTKDTRIIASIGSKWAGTKEEYFLITPSGYTDTVLTVILPKDIRPGTYSMYAQKESGERCVDLAHQFVLLMVSPS